MSNADELRDANPWQPMSDPLDLAHLGKLGEELGELVAAKERCVIQGINECEPVTLKPNKEWLEDEIADVMANMRLVIGRFDLDLMRIERRADRKIAHLRQWHAKIAGETLA
jgi:NTP pyrophosphatase (non-canonical NTP hydrolase)